MRTLQKPSITLLAADHDRLSALAQAAMYIDPDTAELLTAELERARVIDHGQVPRNIVRMSSGILFRDDTTREIRNITLVFPGEADIARNRVSILTPVGTALIGLRAGQSITWRTRSGELKQLTVLKVTNPEHHNTGIQSYRGVSA